MMIGVGFFSTLCIGLLLFVNITAFSEINSRTKAMINLHVDMNSRLRAGIFDLQKKHLEIPGLLETETGTQFEEWFKASFPEVKEECLTGDDLYRKTFSRTQRRDLANGRIIAVKTEQSVMVAKGIMIDNGHFSGDILCWIVSSNQPEEAMAAIQSRIEALEKTARDPDALVLKVEHLKNRLANEALAAETYRNEILYQVETLQKKEAELNLLWDEKRKAISAISGIAVFTNLILLHLMAFSVVEKPLKSLTRALEKINREETFLIPCQHRRDQIGILARALADFQTAQTELRKEEQRKKTEKILIQGLIRKISRLIDTLQKRAAAMKGTAEELSGLAAETEEQTHEAMHSAAKTVEQTIAVSEATFLLQSDAAGISSQVARQTDLISEINQMTVVSRQDIQELTQSSEQIHEILDIVKTLAGKTRFLALNANIEAARASSAGKGFAVLANEIKAFSLQTEAASKDIAYKIRSIETVSRVVIEHIQNIESRIENLMEAGLCINSAVENQAVVTSGIAETSQSTAQDIGTVSERISQVKAAAQSTSRLALDVQSLSKDIANELTDLLSETRNKLAFVDPSDSAEELNDPTSQKEHRRIF